MLSRVGISLEDDLLSRFDELIEGRGYTNRSEAIRDMIRDSLVKSDWEEADDGKPRVAVVCLVYDHEERELGQRLTHEQHHHHDVIISTMHVHMDSRNCLEVLILRGKADEVLHVGNGLISTKGVKLGKLIPATTGEGL